MDSIQFSANKDGSIKAERVIAGVAVDRFNYIQRKSVIKHNPKATWIPRAIVMLEASSACIVIQVPPCPPLEPSQAQRLERMEQQLDEALSHAEHFAGLVEAKQIPG